MTGMNTFYSINRIKLALFGILPAFALVCCDVPTREHLVGTYTRFDGPLVETVALESDGTFRQTVVYSDGQRFEVDDHWRLEHRQVQFARLYITRDLESSRVLYPPQMRHLVNVVWDEGFLVKESTQYVFEPQKKQ